jgi:hypothetical protein
VAVGEALAEARAAQEFADRQWQARRQQIADSVFETRRQQRDAADLSTEAWHATPPPPLSPEPDGVASADTDAFDEGGGGGGDGGGGDNSALGAAGAAAAGAGADHGKLLPPQQPRSPPGSPPENLPVEGRPPLPVEPAVSSSSLPSVEEEEVEGRKAVPTMPPHLMQRRRQSVANIADTVSELRGAFTQLRRASIEIVEPSQLLGQVLEEETGHSSSEEGDQG